MIFRRALMFVAIGKTESDTNISFLTNTVAAVSSKLLRALAHKKEK